MGDLRSICSKLADGNAELTEKCIKDNTKAETPVDQKPGTFAFKTTRVLNDEDIAQMDELCSSYTKADFAKCVKDKGLNMSAFKLSDENLKALCRRIQPVWDKVAGIRCADKYKDIMNDEALRILAECKKVTFAETEKCADAITEQSLLLLDVTL